MTDPIMSTPDPPETMLPGYQQPDIEFQQHDLTGVQPGTDYLKPDALVQDRVTGILGKDSPLMRVANTQAKQMGESRGLLNSASNIRAGIGAMTDKALQIAVPDANTAASMLGRQQVTDYQGALNTQQAQYNLDNVQSQGQISGALKELDNQFQAVLNDRNLNQQARDTLARANASAAQALNVNAEYILRDPDLDAAAKQNAINLLVNQYRANMTTTGNILGLPISWT